jgi:hypothetical protein
MFSAIVLFIALLSFTLWYGQYLVAEYPGTKRTVFNAITWMHVSMSLVYFIYGSLTASDSFAYYAFVENDYRGLTWWDYYGTSTTFIEFIAYPFIKFFGFSYAAMMILFSWFGLIGFFYFYIVLFERIRYRHTFFGYDLLLVILLLPNLHFWSSSLGKGSLIFLGFGLFFYALNKVNKRIVALVIGTIIIYHVRPHIMFVVIVSSTIGFVFSSHGVSPAVRGFIILLSIGAFFYIYKDVLALTGINEDAVLEQGMNLSPRSLDLMKADSGVDISNYSFPMKLFTFWFRPLFVDAPGVMGIIVSFENLFYLFIFFKIFKWDFVRWIRQSDHVVKAALISFLGVSAALAQISFNLGLAMRQKSQVMILMMFVVLKYIDDRMHNDILAKEARKKVEAKPGVAKDRVRVRA